MKSYKIESVSNCWSTQRLKTRVENLLKERTSQGWELVSISFGMNIWWIPAAYVTFIRPENINV